MSLLTPDVEKAAGIVSRFTHAPFANEKKSWQAFAEVSMNDGSKTLSVGGIGTEETEEGVLCAHALDANNSVTATLNVRKVGMVNEFVRNVVAANRLSNRNIRTAWLPARQRSSG